MKTNEAITQLWEEGFFETEKRPIEVKNELQKRYGITPSNTSSHLKSCSRFLRKVNKGWIQKIRHGISESRKDSGVHSFDLYRLAPEIRKVSKKLFDDKHYSQAVLETLKYLNNFIKNKSGVQDDGKSLMLKVFNENNPSLKLNQLSTTSEKNEQEGFKFLFAGAMVGIRNPKAHENIIDNDPVKAMEMLALVNLLFNKARTSHKV
ncbi:TIGR02391 family protein [Candidatus Peregrinibacteria bacterium HGW-Peregrinibacteria-1]|jgi:uncharacterized protein (TIGR02391 family)|nr:MAG: TIGR02391 family protein [Candidatus Peregrinibacteria bacterium HGW-Peregrinibacteria-1]